MEPFFPPILLVSIDTKFRKFTRSTHYHDDTARKHSIRRVEMTQRRRGERRERERDSSNQIHRDSSGHACRSGCTTLYRRLSSPPLDPPLPLRVSTPPHAFLFLALSLSSLMQPGLLPSCLHLIGPTVYTRCLGHV